MTQIIYAKDISVTTKRMVYILIELPTSDIFAGQNLENKSFLACGNRIFKIIDKHNEFYGTDIVFSEYAKFAKVSER